MELLHPSLVCCINMTWLLACAQQTTWETQRTETNKQINIWKACLPMYVTDYDWSLLSDVRLLLIIVRLQWSIQYLGRVAVNLPFDNLGCTSHVKLIIFIFLMNYIYSFIYMQQKKSLLPTHNYTEFNVVKLVLHLNHPRGAVGSDWTESNLFILYLFMNQGPSDCEATRLSTKSPCCLINNTLIDTYKLDFLLCICYLILNIQYRLTDLCWCIFLQKF